MISDMKEIKIHLFLSPGNQPDQYDNRQKDDKERRQNRERKRQEDHPNQSDHSGGQDSCAGKNDQQYESCKEKYTEDNCKTECQPDKRSHSFEYEWQKKRRNDDQEGNDEDVLFHGNTSF